MDDGQGKNPGQMYRQGFMCTGNSRTKNQLLFGSPSATETTGLIGAIELEIYLTRYPTL